MIAHRGICASPDAIFGSHRWAKPNATSWPHKTIRALSTRTYRFADRVGLEPASDGRPCCRAALYPELIAMDKSIDLQWLRRETSSIPCPLTTGSEIVHQAKRG
jgi:hypothetical protein